MESVKTLTLIKEISTDGHSPLLFLCNDLESYYCKFRSGVSLKSEEMDCLFYEILSKRLLDRLGVPCPGLSLIEVSANSYSKSMLNRHKRFCIPGQIYLGSKEIRGAEDLHGISGITNKRAFNQLINPYDLVKIAFFDLWIDNCDRGRDKTIAKEIVDNFLSLQPHEIEQIVSESYNDCPEIWTIPAQLKERIVLFLTNANRIGTAKNLMWSLFK